MLALYNKLSAVLDRRERKLTLLVLFVTIVVSIIEVLGIASIMPFMSVLSNPDIVHKNPALSFVYTSLNFSTTNDFLFFLGTLVLIFLVGSTALKAFSVWMQVYFANLRNFSISNRLVKGYFNHSYDWFLTQNSSKLATSILTEVNRVVHGVLYPSLRLVANGLVAILLVILLAFADPILATGAVLLLGAAYGLIFKYASKKLGIMGSELSQSQRDRLKVVYEGFEGIKDVKVSGLESFFAEKFRVPARKLALLSVAQKLWSEMPSFGMQALIFGGMMVSILYLLKTRGSINQTIPILALYALAGYRLMPALQEIYKQLAEIKFHRPALDSVYNDIRSLDSLANHSHANKVPLKLDNSIILKELEFAYDRTSNKALHNISIEIKKNNTVAFVGSSGSGKTTTVDIILGLLQPDRGSLLIDNQIISSSNLRSWQCSLGYVPQQIFLSDDTIAANIAFGLPRNKIDYDAVEKAARAAHLHEFIINELPEGYETHVGERGMRLSGGQRQRIGIARALYRDPAVLILDEATSALDNITERSVMNAINKLGHKKTIIIIAHRLTTIQNSDTIFLFDKGNILAKGNYEELIKTSKEFRNMAQAQI